uniref:Uncharacterized protein n=1 Tax=Arion vulgaris TaxID=1028688 RepID=A0A0B6ZA54_9EUPU
MVTADLTKQIHRLELSQTALCQSQQITEHVLQDNRILRELRNNMWHTQST